MNRVLRVAAVSGLLVGLCACNNVVSVEPWFTAADAKGLPTFRDGLWVSAESDCRFDEGRPVERWPDCADVSYRRGSESWLMVWRDTDARGRHRRTFAGWERDQSIIANGDPLIGQGEMESVESEPTDKLETDLGASATPLDGADGEAKERESPWRYWYYAIRPTAHDEAGRVTVVEGWGIRCGPLPEPIEHAKPRRRSRAGDDELAEDTPSVTDRPFPGLTVVHDNCIAESVAALRRAAVLSEALVDHGRSHWVRDGWR